MFRNIVISLLICHGLHGQSDTLYINQEVTIVDQAIQKENVGSNDVSWTSDEIDIKDKQSLAQLLQGSENIFIKNYGPGSLSTTSLRGGTAAHTSILWNGLPIQNPMVGQLDISLLNLSSIQNITLQRGGHSSTWGSGAIAGVIQLDNQKVNSKNIEFESTTSIGSYGLKYISNSIIYSKDKFQSRTTYSNQSANNDYSYSRGGIMDTLNHARINIHTVNQDVYLSIAENKELSMNYWGTFSDREIPPTSQQSSSQAIQIDKSHRLALKYKQNFKLGILRAKIAYFNELIDYKDLAIQLNSVTKFNTYVIDLNYETSINKNQQFMLGLSNLLYDVDAGNNYESSVQENRTAAILSWKVKYLKIRGNISLREEIVDGQWTTPVPSFGIEYLFTNDFSLKSKITRFYRLPSLNDKYWQPGGNENLKAEQGWSYEAGIEYRKLKPNSSLTASLTGFSRKLNNWILWSPGNIGFNWSARNLNQVWSRGVESRIQYHKSFNKVKIHLSTGFDYVRSSSEESITIPKIEKGQQLWYTPTKKAFVKVKTQINKLSIAYLHRYTSETIGLNKSLDEYHLGQFDASYKSTLNNINIQYFITFQNLWNTEYRIIEFRPMPGRNIQLGITINFKK